MCCPTRAGIRPRERQRNGKSEWYGDKECLHCKSELQAQGRQGRSRQAVPILSRVTAFCEVCSFWDDGKKEQNIVQRMGHMAVGRGAQLSSFSTASSGQVIFS